MNDKHSAKPLRGLFRALTLLVLVLYAGAAVQAWLDSVDEARTELVHINSMLVQGTRTTLKGHEFVLGGLQGQLVSLGALDEPERGRALIERMNAIDTGMAGFGLARPDGQLVLVSGIPAGEPLPNLATREESADSFAEVLHSRHLRTGRPYYFAQLGHWVVPIRVPVLDASGQVSAVMTAGYAIEGGTTAWANMVLPPNTWVALARSDGYPVYLQPLPDGPHEQVVESIYGQPVAPDVMKRISAISQDDAFLRLYLPRYDDEFFVAFTRLRDVGLVAVTFSPRSTVIAQWLLRMLMPTALMAVFLIGGLLAYRRARQQQERVQARLDSSRQELVDRSDKLVYQARHDSLTGLPNRLVLHERISQFIDASVESGDRAALLLLDLDRFKEINDTLGHHFGDEVLAQLGPRLEQACELPCALTARLGGDEFTILLTDIEGSEKATAVARRVVEVMSQPCVVEGVEMRVSASVGIAYYPDDADDSHGLLRAADVAMYQAKALSLGMLEYDLSFDNYTPERLALAAELAQAVQQRQLVLHYQPKIDIASGETVGFESLVRWNHPRRGLLYPGSFIDLVEMSEVVHPFTESIINLALADKQRLHQLGLHQPVSINLSARNLADGRCLAELKACLQRYQLPVSEVDLELTETSLMHDPAGATELLMQFTEMGVGIAIDDYGAGYSSLAYLRQLPVNALKIDQSFVKDLASNEQNRLIVRSTIGLAHSLNLKVIAEGVEDAESLALLRDMGCDQAQGYFLSRPMTLDAVVGWFGANNETKAS